MANHEASDLKYILYTICRQWTGGDVMIFFVSFEGNLECWKWTFVMFSSHFRIHIYFWITATFLSTNTPTHCSTPHPPQYWQFLIQLIPLYHPKTNHLYCQWQQPTPAILLWSVWHRQQLTTEQYKRTQDMGIVHRILYQCKSKNDFNYV